MVERRGDSWLRRVLSRARLRDERGVALTEFALVLPVLMLLLLGMLDLGKAFNYWIDQTHLANLGARWAAVDKNVSTSLECTGFPTLQACIRSKANTDELKSAGTSDSVPDGVKVCLWYPEGGAKNVGNSVEVQVWSVYHFIPFVGNKVSFLTTEITGSATMRIEQIPLNNVMANNDAGAGHCA